MPVMAGEIGQNFTNVFVKIKVGVNIAVCVRKKDKWKRQTTLNLLIYGYMYVLVNWLMLTHLCKVSH